MEIGHNAAFRERILTIYRDLAPSPKSASSRRVGGHAKAAKPQLTPIRQVDPKLFGPDKPLDPYLVHYAYGDDQLRPALERFPGGELKKAAVLVEQRNPGTKPENRSQKAALINYIVAHVTKRP